MKLFELYFHASVFGSVIILLTLLLRYFLKQAPRKYLCILWLLAALRLLVPFHLESTVSFQPNFYKSEIVISAEPSTIPSETVTEQPSTPADVTVPTVIPDTAPSIAPEQIITTIWITIGIALLSYGVISYGCLKFRVRHAIRHDDGIMESNRIAGGFLLGYFKPNIYIPTNLSEKDRGFIIAHEQVHKARGDHWCKLAGFLCCCIHWYNPLVWVGYWLLCRDIEIACDESVVQKMTLEQRKEYSLALLNCGKRLSGFLVCPVAFGEVSLKQRIRNVLSYRRSGFWFTIVTVVLVIFVAVCFLTSPKTAQESLPSEPSVTEPTSPSTLPSATTTEPQPETEPVVDTTIPTTTAPAITVPATTAPEPVVTEPPATTPTTTPPTTKPAETKPVVTEPSTTTPTQPPSDNGVTIIAEGKWDGGPVRWKVTSDGTLTITGNRSIQGATNYIWKDYDSVITKIVVDDGIISIPRHAFSGMTHVKEVYLGQKINEIGEFAFYGCISLQSVSIPAQVGEIKESTFSGCSGLRSLKFAKFCQVEGIGRYAFANSGLTSFICPDSLKELDSTSFNGCTSLQYYESKEGIFRGSSLSDGKNFLTVDGLESVELYSINRSFKNCRNLKSVVISGNGTTIKNGMFENCTSLTEVTINAPITKIEGYAFQGCASLRSVTIPNTVTEIGIRAFAGTGISKIIIPPSVKEMGWCVFEDSKLSQIEFQGDIPKFINNSTFSGASVTACYPADNPSWTEDLLKNYGGKITWLPL